MRALLRMLQLYHPSLETTLPAGHDRQRYIQAHTAGVMLARTVEGP